MRIVNAVLLCAVMVFLTVTGHAKDAGKDVVLGCAFTPLSAPVMIAERMGYFKKEGLDVKIIEFPSGKTALKTMLEEGNINMVTAAQGPVMFNSFKRSDYAIIAAMVSTDKNIKVLVNRDKGIKTPADLKGKKIGLTKGSGGQFFFGMFLTYNDLEPADVEIVDFEATELSRAISDGSVDAICSWEPNIINTQALLGEKALLLPSKGIFREDFYFVASRKFIENNPEILKRFLKAIDRAEKYLLKKSKKSIAIVSEWLKSDKESTAAILSVLNFELMLDQTILVTLEDEARWAIREGLTDKKEVPNYLDFIYMDALEDVKPEAVTIIR
ncbi:MAG: ABC transporter substrate-binding protein [bacterium]